MSDWQTFMLESNRIEGEDRLNPGDRGAFDFACKKPIDSLESIKTLHLILGKYLKEDWVGQWREVDVRVGKSRPPSHIAVPNLMKGYWIIYPDLDSYDAHNRFEFIHPFEDLNGRVGRLIWLSKAIYEGYDFQIPFLQKYYYQTLSRI